MKSLLFFLLITAGVAAEAQSLPANTCGIVYSYDAGGNRTQRKYVCNNSLAADPGALLNTTTLLSDVQMTTTLFPNPTTGIFTLAFTKPLSAAKATIIDAEGRVVQSRVLTGSEFEFDISILAAGVYSVRVQDGNKVYIFKVIRQ